MWLNRPKKETPLGSFKNGIFDSTSPSKKPNWYMEFQHETNIVLKDLFFRWNAETN